MRDVLRAAWTEPAPPNRPGRGWRDWALAAVALALVGLELVLRQEFIASALAASLVPTLLFRRTHPFTVVAIAAVTGSVATVTGVPDSYATAFVLILPYALCRWGSGRAVLAGSLVMLSTTAVVYLSGKGTAGEAAGGAVVVFATLTLGLAMRFRTRAKAKELDQLRSVERERLARDLHDTVAHHVSAIAVRAQAGLLTARSEPAAATQALQVIEAEASRALAEMRAIVRVLRDGEPQPQIRDLDQLTDGAGPAVHIRLAGDVDDIAPAVQTAIYHLARESVTNARRHARGATRIEVVVRTDKDSVHLTVEDDGIGTAAADAAGFGLVGMGERAGLVGGVCRAGPNQGRGWTVAARLPRLGTAA